MSKACQSCSQSSIAGTSWTLLPERDGIGMLGVIYSNITDCRLSVLICCAPQCDSRAQVPFSISCGFVQSGGGRWIDTSSDTKSERTRLQQISQPLRQLIRSRLPPNVTAGSTPIGGEMGGGLSGHWEAVAPSVHGLRTLPPNSDGFKLLS